MFDLGEDAGTRYITMEYVHGEDLKQILRKMGRPSPGQAVGIAVQICDGLAEAHKLGVVHRDLKSQNIMPDEDGNARIMDFGIARSLSGKGITGAGVMVGTPEYRSPEQVEGKDLDRRSDIYSLGIILFEMVTGRVPFEGETPFTIGVKQKSETPQDPRALNAEVPESLSRVILRCLEKDRAERYASAAELAAEIDRLLMKLQTLPSLPDRALYSNCYEAGRALRVHGYRKESSEYFERAFAELRNRPESEKASVIYRSDLVNCLMALDKWDEARDEIEALDKADPDNLSHQFLGALIAAKLGNREEAQRISDELGRVEQPYPLSFIIPFYQGGIAAFLGEKDKAVKFLQKTHAHGLGFGTANMFPFNQALEPLFDYPPFKEFVKPKG